MDNDLPFIDEHRVLVAAPALTAWRCLAMQYSRSPLGGEAFARVLAAHPRQATGKPFDEGATFPGFEVTEVVPGRRVRLTGRHRFSRYALVFTLVSEVDGTMLSAGTYAEFPGLRGWVYRRLVISSGAHRIIVARLLRAVRRRAERLTAPDPSR
jgi:hypothetical protein